MAQHKILAIDDEQELLDLLKMSLELEGYEVITAFNGEEGIAKWKEHNPDLIICDIIMPKVDGYAVLDEVKKKGNRWVPFIMLSAISDFDKMKKAHEGDIDFYLTKPVPTEILIKNIKTLLNLAKHRIV